MENTPILHPCKTLCDVIELKGTYKNRYQFFIYISTFLDEGILSCLQTCMLSLHMKKLVPGRV